ncbi:MAG: helix-turn-helix domain-containing protein [Bacteroidales bacterium]|nr:helix-turn-helix domain-containing protein [Bacteroidales bacterium]
MKNLNVTHEQLPKVVTHDSFLREEALCSSLKVTHENFPSVISQLFKEVTDLKYLLLMQLKQTEAPQQDLIPIKEACEMLNLSLPTIYSKCSRREIPYHKPKGTKKLFFSRTELMEYLGNGRVKTADEVYNDVSIKIKKGCHE